jgi:phosphoribosylaminoimidazolecarboxamide formyltransferase / IMP cyclohydrolase
MIKRALISVSDKTGIVEFARNLIQLGVEIVSTGGTSQLLRDQHIAHQTIEDITGFPEIFDGRVKTLHPKIHGGILGRRDLHGEEAKQHQIDWIDLVVVNFYPFKDILKKPHLSWEEAIEYIDVGGPTMVRAAAKNFASVTVVVDPADYATVLNELTQQQDVSFATRKNLAAKVFKHTTEYDAMIYDYFHGANQEEGTQCPEQIHLHLEKSMPLRYGENPHQLACAYRIKENASILSSHQHQGKALSFNNLLDVESAWQCVNEFIEPACVIVKHANPCGVAVASNIEEAFLRAFNADATSAFGGIVALNHLCNQQTAQAMINQFIEVVIAPGYTQDALQLLSTKPNLRVLENKDHLQNAWEMKFITGGVLYQQKDQQTIQAQDLQMVTEQKPDANDIENILFSWRVLKHVKSNGILIAKNNTTIGIGAGHVSRVDAVDTARRKAGKDIHNAVLASDAFFPFRDSIDKLAGTGLRAIVQPGGSVRDAEVIQACNEHQIAMVFTGKRCFRH